jgi:hypothetical protein
VNSIIATESVLKLYDTKTIKYFITKEVGTEPVEENLSGVILVINYEATLDITINEKTV